MNNRLSVLVAYGSLHVGARIIRNLAQFPQVDVIGQSREADDAVFLIKTQKPRLVIADIALERGTGVDVLRQVKAITHPPLVIITSESWFPQDRRECLKAGADYYFRLPHEMDDLENVIGGLAHAKPDGTWGARTSGTERV